VLVKQLGSLEVEQEMIAPREWLDYAMRCIHVWSDLLVK
jgi:hypothetical protein